MSGRRWMHDAAPALNHLEVCMIPDLSPGNRFPDMELPDHGGNQRRLSELAGGDPLVLNFYRGWW